jgi:hypothetical protein
MFSTPVKMPETTGGYAIIAENPTGSDLYFKGWRESDGETMWVGLFRDDYARVSKEDADRLIIELQPLMPTRQLRVAGIFS